MTHGEQKLTREILERVARRLRSRVPLASERGKFILEVVAVAIEDEIRQLTGEIKEVEDVSYHYDD